MSPAAAFRWAAALAACAFLGLPWVSAQLIGQVKAFEVDLQSQGLPALGIGSEAGTAGDSGTKAETGEVARNVSGCAALGVSLVEAWDLMRRHLMWPAQGLGAAGGSAGINGGINKAQAAEYAQLLNSNPVPVRTVCETGFFYGGSSLFWLLLAPQSHLHTFDLAFRPGAVEFLNQHFPGRITYHEGDTAVTVPEFVNQVVNGTFPPCDFISVDGNHNGEGPYTDIMHLTQASSPGATLVADDTFNCRTSVPHCTVCSGDCECAGGGGTLPFCNACSEGFFTNVDQARIRLLFCRKFGLSPDGLYPVGFCASQVERLAN